MGQIVYQPAAGGGGGGGASWSTIHEIDFTSDITDLTLTKGGGDTTLYEGDGTTPKATVGFVERLGTATATCEITAAAGGFTLTSNSGGASIKATHGYVALTESGTGIDWDDHTKVYAIDLVFDSLVYNAGGDVMNVALGTSSSGIVSGTVHGVRTDRDAGPDYNQAGRRYHGSAENGSQQNSSVTAPTDFAIRLIIEHGSIVTAWWSEGTTRLSGFPTASASVFRSFEGTKTIGMEAATESVFSANFYVFFECLTNTGTNNVSRLLSLRVQEYG